MEFSLIPESAPFSTEQRAWLNGFLAGWVGINPAAPGAVTALPAGLSLAPPAAEAEPEPWHDPALPIVERLKLAEDKPLPRRLMAAMAQLDCGACGYLCRTYAEAIAGGAEARLSLCSPGGSETSKTLKKLLKEQPASNGTPVNGVSKNGVHVNGNSNGHATPAKATNGWSRENPFPGLIVRTENLNAAESEKETRHVEIALGDAGPSYEVGDSLGVYPENCPELVAEVIDALGATGEEAVGLGSGAPMSLRDALGSSCCLTEVTEALLEQVAGSATDPDEAAAARALIDDDGPIAGWDVLDLLRKFPSARPEPGVFAGALSALKPRLYSISSSPKRHAGHVHLTVRKVAYHANGRGRKGVASTMFAERVAPGKPVRVFVQKSHGFSLPADPTAPIVMIGPGTGIAPFRAFLHERDARGDRGRSWLFYGDQRAAHDFLYERELSEFLARGVLTRLDTAFSRDQDEKVYVQHRIIERGAELLDWLRDGAHLFVCGDAKRMAADVDRALREVFVRAGGLTESEARNEVAKLKAEGRYKRDVY